MYTFCLLLLLSLASKAVGDSSSPSSSDLNTGGFTDAPAFVNTKYPTASYTTSTIKTIVGCDAARNNEAGKNGSKLTCTALLDKALKILNGGENCAASQNFMLPHNAGTPVRCTAVGSTEEVKSDGTSVSSSMAVVAGKREIRNHHTHSRRATQNTAACSLDTIPQGYYTNRFNATTIEQNGIGNCAKSKTDLTLNSIYIEFTAGDYRVIATNGIPDHSYNQLSANVPCEHYKVMIVPANPSLPSSGETCAFGKGPIGLGTSGAAFYDHLTDFPVCSTAYVTNFATFGECGGHANNQKEWHYHGPSNCLVESVGECQIIGYMTDGFPLWNKCSTKRSCYKINKSYKWNCTAVIVDGEGKSWQNWTIFEGCDAGDYEYDSMGITNKVCELDEANFYNDPQGKTTGYYITDTYPFTIPKRRAKAGNLCVIQF